MNVLHLVNPGSPAGGACTLRLLAEPLTRLTGVRQDVLIAGTRAHASLAERCGVTPRGVLPQPGGRPRAGWRALKSAMRHLERGGRRYDLIHAWTLPSARLADLAAPERRCLVTLGVGPVTDFASQVMLRRLVRTGTRVLASTSGVRRELTTLGVKRVVRMTPGVDPECVVGDRAELRRRWGVDDGTFVVGLLSEPADWSDARTMVNVIMRLSLTGRRVRLLLHHGATGRAQAEKWLRRVSRDRLDVADDEVAEPWKIVRGLDAALLVGRQRDVRDLSAAGTAASLIIGGGRCLRPMSGVMPLLWAMAAAVPVIAEDADAVRDVVDDGRTGLLVDTSDGSAICERIMRLYDDRTEAQRLAMQGRTAVLSGFDADGYCRRLAQTYEGLVGAHASA